MKTLMMTTAALLLAVPALGAKTVAADEVRMLEAMPSVDELRGYLAPDSPRRTRSIEIVAGLVKPQASRPAAYADAAATMAMPQAAAAPSAPAASPAAVPMPEAAEPPAESAAAEAAEPAEPAEPAGPVTIGYRIQFAFDSADILAESRPFLDQLGRLLAEEADLALVVEGHTDARGSAPYNLALSLRRAEAVKGYLSRTWEVESGRLVVEGLGENEPLSRRVEAAENRRVQFRRAGA